MSDYEDLKWRYEDLRERYWELEKENNSLRQRLDESEYQIRNELEPRIKAEERRYDRWATSPERG